MNLQLFCRSSRLSQLQAQIVKSTIHKASPASKVVLAPLVSEGDVIQHPLRFYGGKKLFTSRIDQALLAEKTPGFAVHSLKDMETCLQPALTLAAVLTRDKAGDVLVTKERLASLNDLPAKAKIGTVSLRREAQLRQIYPNMQIIPLRGNVPTRLEALQSGQMDALILSCAAMNRLGLAKQYPCFDLPLDHWLPAPGQGVIAMTCREEDHATKTLLTQINDKQTWALISLERYFLAQAGLDCFAPAAVYAMRDANNVIFEARLYQQNGDLLASTKKTYPFTQLKAIETLNEIEGEARKFRDQYQRRDG